MFKTKNLSRLIIFLPILFIIITVIYSSSISISQLKKHFSDEIKSSKHQELEKQKQYIKNKIDSVYTYIEHKKIEASHRLKKQIKTRLFTGHDLMNTIYEENKHTLSTKELEKKILDTLRKIRFGTNGYYFILHLKNDKEIIAKLLPSTPHLENTNTYNFKDLDGKYYPREFAKIGTENKEGFVNYKYYKLSQKKEFSKISFVKVFEPYNWIIGYGEYMDDIERSVKKEAKERLDLFRFKNEGYVWTHSTDYQLLQHPFRQESIGIDDSDLGDKKGTKIIQMFVEKALNNKEGEFVTYYWNKPNEQELTQKIGFVRHIKDWDWVIGTGVYVEDIDTLVNSLIENKNNHIDNTIIKLVILSLFVLIIATFVFIFIAKKINNTLKDYEEEIQEKHIIISQQSKMAALGEMIGHIAHQWRQPLSVITTVASSWSLYNELGKLDTKKILKESEVILSNADYLSNTIDDFRYFTENKVSTLRFNTQELFENMFNIQKFTIENNHIQLHLNIDNKQEVVGSQSEVTQCLINIINNAIHELVKKKELRLLFIDIINNEDDVIIAIKDNAGGIPSTVIDKVFEPYFTTKHQSQGTGLGLYMSYTIMKKMNGDLNVENVNYVYDNEKYRGAQFLLKLPKRYT